ncbi:MAG: 50S ribosomal protein L24 [Clostridia bacterium]|nr:50S ribosomal protein L24 [Clostridia bacterium]
MAKLFVKKGDTVVVVAGKEKGKTAKVLEVSPKDNRVLVENVNVVTKHQKQRNQQEKGGIIKKNAPIDASNVMVVCPECGKATRVAHKEVDGKKVRICKKCDASLDKAAAKKVKKQAKEAKKVEETVAEEPKKAKTATKSTTAKKTTAKKAEAK